MTQIRNGRRPEHRTFHHDASIVLVGSRGSGKRSLGFIGATTLGRRFITEDHYFGAVTGVSRADFLKAYGSEKFYKQTVEVLRRMLFDNKEKCIIECGMGSLAGDAQAILREYAETNPVIYVVRNSKSISRLLNLDPNGAARLEQADLTHRSCSNLEYYNLYDSTCEGDVKDSPKEDDRASPSYSFKLRQAKEDFSVFLNVVTGDQIYPSDSEGPFSIKSVPAELRSHTYSLGVRFSDFLEQKLNFDELELDSGGDVIELSIDVQPPGSLKLIAKQVALIRRKMQVPIIFHVDRDFRATIGEAAYFELLMYGMRLGVEYVAVDIKCKVANFVRLVEAKGRTKIVGDYFDARSDSSQAWSDGSMVMQYLRAEKLHCDLVRLSRTAARGDDVGSLLEFRKRIQGLPRTGAPLPLIAYNLGAFGHTSQVLNPIFTPVTGVSWSDLGIIIKRDPDHLTAQEAMQELYRRSIFDPLHFCLVGVSVYYSLSAAMHNAAYQICGMGHDYQIRQSSTLDELHALSQDPHFGGASISHPFKVGIVPKLKAMSKHATAIGAVNTLLPIRSLPDGSTPDYSTASLLYQANNRGSAGPVVAWYGDNTDWIGISVCLQRNLSPRNAIQRKTTGLVIGAGGMARSCIYAMIQVGCRKIFVYNRTVERAEAVAHHFNSQHEGPLGPVVEVLKSLNDPWPAAYHQPTMIISGIPAHQIDDDPAPNFNLPEQWLQSPSGGVVLELAYKPFVTPLLQQMHSLREAGHSWAIVDGLEVLPEQGIAQFELLTGRKAPKGRMRLEVLRRYRAAAESGAEEGLGGEAKDESLRDQLEQTGLEG